MSSEFKSVRQRMIRRVRQEMNNRKWNVCTLATRARVSPAQTYRVIGGRAVPSLKWIVHVANALEIPPSSLLPDE